MRIVTKRKGASESGKSPRLDELTIDRNMQMIVLGNPHCCSCGRSINLIFHHYLQKTGKGREFLATHPVTPILCESCACMKSNHGDCCVVWEGAKCIVSEDPQRTNTTLY
jgi:hypothetical protein